MTVVTPALAQRLQFAANCNDFTFNMYKELAGKPGNMFASPKNMLDCLAMVYLGAKEGTAVAMQKACAFDKNPDVVAEQVGEVNKMLTSQKDCIIRTANGIWAQEDYAFNANYTKALKEVFGAKFAKVNYKDAANHQTISDNVNSWVEEQTKGEDGEGKIKDLVNTQFFSTDSRLTLVSAIYFLGSWANKFKEKDTTLQPFFLSGGDKANCRLMTRKGEYRYLENETFQMVDMPYVGNELRMAVFLPWLKNGTEAVEKAVKGSTFNKLVRQAYSHEVILSLPKWKVTGDYDLKDPMVNLGMEVAFTDDANFQGMIEQDTPESADGLKIGKAVHKAFVDVTEKGTEAAAATAVGMMRCMSAAAPPQSKVFRADHPFLYVIHHVPTGVALFVGRLSKPEGY